MHISSTSKKNQGFTLIEFLVSFAILLLIIGTASFTFLRSASRDFALQTAARQITADLRYAAELSVSTQVRHLVRFDAAAGTYTVAAREDPERIIKDAHLGEQLSFGAISLTGATVEFNNLGAVTEAGTVMITHVNGAARTIDIRPSGYVRIE